MEGGFGVSYLTLVPDHVEFAGSIAFVTTAADGTVISHSLSVALSLSVSDPAVVIKANVTNVSMADFMKFAYQLMSDTALTPTIPDSLFRPFDIIRYDKMFLYFSPLGGQIGTYSYPPGAAINASVHVWDYGPIHVEGSFGWDGVSLLAPFQPFRSVH